MCIEHGADGPGPGALQASAERLERLQADREAALRRGFRLFPVHNKYTALMTQSTCSSGSIAQQRMIWGKASSHHLTSTAQFVSCSG